MGDAEGSDEDIQLNVQDISRSGDLSPRKILNLKKDKRKSRNTRVKGSQIQTRSVLAKPAGRK